MGPNIGVRQGDTRSLENGSCVESFASTER